MDARCTHQKLPKINLGNHHRNRTKLAMKVASKLETQKIDDAIAALKKARGTDSEPAFIANITEAFKLTREIARSRLA